MPTSQGSCLHCLGSCSSRSRNCENQHLRGATETQKERKRGREKGGHRQTHTQTHTGTDTQTQTQTHRHRHRHTHTDTHTHTNGRWLCLPASLPPLPKQSHLILRPGTRFKRTLMTSAFGLSVAQWMGRRPSLSCAAPSAPCCSSSSLGAKVGEDGHSR